MNRPKDSMSEIFSEPQQAPHRAPPSVRRSFADKVVSQPNCTPFFTRRPTAEPSRNVLSTVFDAPDELHVRHVQPTQMHTNPFDSQRQGALEPPRVRRAPEFEHPEPRPTGMRHVEPAHKPIHASIISPAGLVSGGGRKHITGLPDNNSDHKVESKRIVNSHAAQPCNDSFELAVVLPQEEVTSNKLLFGSSVPEPNSRGKKLFEERNPPSLTGVMDWNTQEQPKGFTYHPPWHRSSPDQTPRKNDIVSSRVRRVASTAELRAGKEEQPRLRKVIHSQSLQPPWHCDPTA
jgi:hypothetical protein